MKDLARIGLESIEYNKNLKFKWTCSRNDPVLRHEFNATMEFHSIRLGITGTIDYSAGIPSGVRRAVHDNSYYQLLRQLQEKLLSELQ